MVEPTSPTAGVGARRDYALKPSLCCPSVVTTKRSASLTSDRRARVQPHRQRAVLDMRIQIRRDVCDTGEDRSACFAVHPADTNSRACHAVPTEPILRSPVGARRTDSKYATKTTTHSTSINTAIPAW